MSTPDLPSPIALEEVFRVASKLPAAKRTAYLGAACEGQPEMRARVERMLEVGGIAAFLQRGANETVPPEIGAEMEQVKPEEGGERIGNYRLLQQIGEGGFGTVWMAEQIEPVTRRVALKIIKMGMDTREVIARFEAERQALAMMDHPNIAKILDAGATDKGRPFFVMELVKGIPITRFCDDQEFSTRQRLELFAEVCSAINHAHQKGVIHRDIKPSNVMVSLQGDKPVPKVIDFGIAKATQGRLTNKTLFTRFEQFVGTPVYMSPEQTSLSGLDIDTRSDIYALGILLYELLTGKPPFDVKSLVSDGYEELRRIIREVDPPKPSSQLSTVAGDERTTLAKARQIAPEKLSRIVEPDLDWIVMKAIEKDRTRRYETANGLALDIQRFLADEPVSATPPAAGYRFRKFARRNKAALRVAAAIAVVLITATAVSISQAVRATRAENRATQKTSDERAAREDAEAVSSFLSEVFQSPDPDRDGRTIAVAEMLDRAATKLETDIARQPERRAKLQGALGRTYHALGLYDKAIPLQKSARDYFLGAHGKEHDDTLNSMRDLANSHHGAGDYDEALELREAVAAFRLKMSGPTHRETLRAKDFLATSWQADFRLTDALKLREEVLELRAGVLGPDDPDTLRAMHVLALSYHSAYRGPEAIPLQRKALERSVKVNSEKHPDTLAMMHNLANLLDDCGDPAEARRLRQDELVFRKEVNGENHSDTLRCRSNLAESIYKVEGNSAKAIGMMEELVNDYRYALGREHRDTLFAIVKLAEFYVSAGRPGEALPLVETMAAFPPTAGAMLILRLTALQAWLGRDAEYAATCRRALELAAATTNRPTAERAAKGYCLRPSSDPGLLQRALALARDAVDRGREDPYLAWYQLALGMAEFRQGTWPAADMALAAAERGAERSGIDRPFILNTARLFHAMSLFQQRKVQEARELFVTAEAQMKPLPAEGQPFKERAENDDLILWLACKEARSMLQPEK